MRRRVACVCLVLASCSGAKPASPSRKPNVLLITIDTLRADRVGRGLTPAIDGLAARGVRFTNARATAPLTLPSHASILTGALPPEHGVRLNGVRMASRATLAQTFKDAGYRTAAFVGAYVLDARFGLAIGFDTYDDRVVRDGSVRLEAERRGDAVVDAALPWLQRTDDRPFFAWIHLYDPHAPYEPPQAFLDKAKGIPYDGEVAFADAQVGRLLDWVQSSGQTDRTIVAVTGDHGEGLGDHGESTHGMLAYDSTLRIPLVVANPTSGSSRLQPGDQPITLADLAGTLIQIAGLSIPNGMRTPSTTGEAYAETAYPQAAGWHPLNALAFDQWKVILSSEAELYDVRVDPGETRNLAGEKLAVVEGARRRLAELNAAKGASASVPADAADRLRALGYVSGGSTAVDANAPNPASGIASWNAFERELTRLSAGDARGALPGLAKLARANPAAPVFQATYARALKDTGRARDAVDLYRRLVARWPQDAAMYHDLAVAASAAGMPAEAVRAEEASLALQPDNAAASNGLGLLLVVSGASGAHARAIEAFERAVKDDPSNATFWSNLGNARRDAGDGPGAERAYRRGLDADPRSPDPANGLGVLLVQQKRAADAIPWFERALAASPAFVEARLNLGIAHQEAGNREKAIEAYRRVLAEASAGSREHTAATQLLASVGRQ